jgi:very-short-patch-repair endonuclease
MTICECGCGTEIKPWCKFAHGHNARTKNPWQPPPVERELCKCGCGELALLGNTFVNGHNPRKNIELPPKLQCECGCGQEANNGKRFIRGHDNKTPERRKKSREVINKLQQDPEWMKASAEASSKRLLKLNKNPTFRKNRSEAVSGNWNKPGFLESQRIKFFKQAPESQRQLFELLKNLGFTVEFEYIIAFEAGHRFYDLCFPNLNILVEIDGSYWHDDINNLESELLKNDLARINGFKLIRIIHDTHHRMAEVLLPQLPDVI